MPGGVVRGGGRRPVVESARLHARGPFPEHLLDPLVGRRPLVVAEVDVHGHLRVLERPAARGDRLLGLARASARGDRGPAEDPRPGTPRSLGCPAPRAEHEAHVRGEGLGRCRRRPVPRGIAVVPADGGDGRVGGVVPVRGLAGASVGLADRRLVVQPEPLHAGRDQTGPAAVHPRVLLRVDQVLLDRERPVRGARQHGDVRDGGSGDCRDCGSGAGRCRGVRRAARVRSARTRAGRGGRGEESRQKKGRSNHRISARHGIRSLRGFFRFLGGTRAFRSIGRPFAPWPPVHAVRPRSPDMDAESGSGRAVGIRHGAVDIPRIPYRKADVSGRQEP